MPLNTRLVIKGADLCAGICIDNQAGIDDALLRGIDSDESMLSVLMYLRQQTFSVRRMASSAFANVAYFYVDSPIQKLASIAKRSLSIQNGSEWISQAMSNRNGNLCGLELANSTANQFVVFLPDASQPGYVRYSSYDDKGFFGHATFANYQLAIQAAWDNGYRTECIGMLNTLCVTPAWAAGSKVTLLIQQLNLGKISFNEYLEQLAA